MNSSNNRTNGATPPRSVASTSTTRASSFAAKKESYSSALARSAAAALRESKVHNNYNNSGTSTTTRGSRTIRKAHSTLSGGGRSSSHTASKLRERLEEKLKRVKAANNNNAEEEDKLTEETQSDRSSSGSGSDENYNDDENDCRSTTLRRPASTSSLASVSIRQDVRLERYKRLLAKGNLPVHLVEEDRKLNSVKLHIYDLIERDALLNLDICYCPIGYVFKGLNDGLHCLGTGAYHVGIEVNGTEYAYGSHTLPNMSGVFTCKPQESPGYAYRCTLDFGKIETKRTIWVEVPTSKTKTVYRDLEISVEGIEVLQEMSQEYMGTDYDLLRKNCCTFANDALLRLGVPAEDIPKWFSNAAKAGADASDLYYNTVVNPFKVFGNNYSGDNGSEVVDDVAESGFEVLLLSARMNRNLVKVVEVHDDDDDADGGLKHTYEMRKTLTWTT